MELLCHYKLVESRYQYIDLNLSLEPYGTSNILSLTCGQYELRFNSNVAHEVCGEDVCLLMVHSKGKKFFCALPEESL